MNMMVNTSELVGNEAEKTKLNGIALKSAVSKLVASWERKQAGKLGSFGLMAISLAACNASSTAVVEEEAEAEAPAPVVPVTNAITIAAATTNAFGTANQDIITAAQADLTSAHIIADATTGDNDSLTVTLTGDYAATPTVIGVETVTFNIGETLASGNGTLSVAVDNITASSDSIHFDVTNAESLIANLTVTGAGTNNYAPSTELTTVEIQSVADADVTVTLAADMSLSTTTGAGDDLTVNGGTAFDVTLTASTATEDLVVSGLDNTITAASILGNVAVTSAGDTALTAVAAVGNVTITGGDDVTAADVRASTGTVTINSTGIIGGVDARAATTLVANNTGAPSGEDVTITNASAATAVTLTSVGSITATANSMAAAAAVTATAAEDSAITADGVADQVLNLNADSSGVALTPEVTYTILASTVETINLGGPTAIEVIIDPADISTETVTSTNATSAALNFTTSNSADTTEVASGIVMRLGIDHAAKTFTVANSNNFALTDNVPQTAAALIFDHTTAGTITSNNTMTLSTYDDDGAAAGNQEAAIAGLVFTDVNDLTIAMSAVGINSSADITGADLESITITGSGAFNLGANTITGNSSASLSDVTVDASAVTGVVTMALDATAAGVEVLSWNSS